EIIYSGHKINAIYKANINIQEKIAITKPIITNLSNHVYALQPIFDSKSHEHLLSLGTAIK
ncbi:MAG: hypothetical protein KKH40_05255, partial [Nanoarchaeota archaeon]|nr:hypothetical protein [Nanoarchaeota archaeon]